MKVDVQRLDRRIIYLFMVVVVSVPLLTGLSMPPARMKAAERLFSVIDELKPEQGKIALVVLDFGPSTRAENKPQSLLMLEHLMRKRIPVALFSQYALAEGLLNSIPQEVADRLMRENPNERWQYGVDWVNLGYRPGADLFIQSLAKSDNIIETFKVDSFGTSLGSVPLLKGVRTIKDVIFLGEITGLSGVFDSLIQFFQREGYRPRFGHGCTSITIPEAYIYLDSGQLSGLLEGVAGAAWYAELLNKHFKRSGTDEALKVNTALGVAHLAIIFLILLGNAPLIVSKCKRGQA
jgi:hypothetical protein